MLVEPQVLEWSGPGPKAIDPDVVLRLSGHRNPGGAAPVVRDAAGAMASLAARLSVPHAWLRRCTAGRAGIDGTVVIGPDTRFRSRALARLLRGATDAILMLLSIGPSLEQRSRELAARGDLLGAMMLDTAGTVAVHQALGELKGYLRDTAARGGFNLTPRLAPGYADWSLTEQRALFALLDRPGLGIRLTETGLLLPVKSVSGIYGLVHAAPAAVGAVTGVEAACPPS